MMDPYDREHLDAATGTDADRIAFERFVRESEPRLRTALTAAYGPLDGRNAALDALSWAWEHWGRVQTLSNPVGYLFRVGCTAARRGRIRDRPFAQAVIHTDPDVVEPGLLPALARLSSQQRTVVLLIHAFGWTHRETAVLLGLTPSSVQTHARRGMSRLRKSLGSDGGPLHLARPQPTLHRPIDSPEVPDAC